MTCIFDTKILTQYKKSIKIKIDSLSHHNTNTNNHIF